MRSSVGLAVEGATAEGTPGGRDGGSEDITMSWVGARVGTNCSGVGEEEGVEEGEEEGEAEGNAEGSGETSSAAGDTPDLLFLIFPFLSTSDPEIISFFRGLPLSSEEDSIIVDNC